MQTSIDFIEALKAKTGAASDYALAKEMGITRQAISNYRSGKVTFSDEMALKAASMLEIEAGIILAAVHAERAKTEAEKSAWKLMFERLGGVAAMVACGIMLSGFYPTESRASTDVSPCDDAVQSIHYATQWRFASRGFSPTPSCDVRTLMQIKYLNATSINS